MHPPLQSNKEFFKSLFDIIAVEMEGICICGGDFNVIMVCSLDTTNFKRNKKSITKVVKKMDGRKWVILMFGEASIPSRGTLLTIQLHIQFTPELTISLCRKGIGI